MNRNKLIIVGVLAVMIFAVLIALVYSKNNSQSVDTVRVGENTFQHNSTNYPDYKTSNGAMVNIANAEKLSPFMSNTAVSILQTNLKSALYQKTSAIASVASIVSKVNKQPNNQIQFDIQIDANNNTYTIVAGSDGSVVKVEQK